jgi:hypothetical protein
MVKMGKDSSPPKRANRLSLRTNKPQETVDKPILHQLLTAPIIRGQGQESISQNVRIIHFRDFNVTRRQTPARASTSGYRAKAEAAALAALEKAEAKARTLAAREEADAKGLVMRALNDQSNQESFDTSEDLLQTPSSFDYAFEQPQTDIIPVRLYYFYGVFRFFRFYYSKISFYFL